MPTAITKYRSGFENLVLGASDTWDQIQAGVILAADVFEDQTVSNGLAKLWDGSAWVAKPVKYWDNSSWVAKPMKRWDGSFWV
jgi:hypothetical protein